MKIALSTAEAGFRTILEWESGPYDAIAPSNYLVVENRIRKIDADRVAIAVALILYDYLAGSIILPKACSPEVSRELASLFTPRSIQFETVEYQPFAKPGGTRTALIKEFNNESYNSPPQADGNDYDLMFGVSCHQQFCSTISVQNVELACNLRLLCRSNSKAEMLALIGLTVLFAEDFGIGQIRTPRDCGISADLKNKLRILLRQTNLQIV